MKFFVIALIALIATPLFGQTSTNGPSTTQKSADTYIIDNNDDSLASQKLDVSSGSMGVIEENTQVSDQYNFDHNITMNTVSFNKKGVEDSSQQMTLHFSDGSSKFGMIIESPQTGKTSVIIDNELGQMITLMDTQGQKIGMSANLDIAKIAGNQSGTDSPTSEKISFTKTGNTKTISGYSCEEYLLANNLKNNDGNQKMWVTNDTDSDWMKAMSSMSKSNKMFANGGQFPSNFPEGTLIQIVIENNKGIPQTATTIEKIMMDTPSTIKTSDYTFMNFGGGEYPTK